MRRIVPSAAHPQLQVITSPGRVEYRLENWYTAPDGSGRIVRKDSWSSWDAIFAMILAYLYLKTRENIYLSILVAAAMCCFIYTKLIVVLSESVIAYPPHGVQLETHSGFPSWPLHVSRTFIPIMLLQDVVINEGLRGWDVRYCLLFLRKSLKGEYSLVVAYKNILPHFPILLEVYHGLMKTFEEDVNLAFTIPDRWSERNSFHK